MSTSLRRLVAVAAWSGLLGAYALSGAVAEPRALPPRTAGEGPFPRLVLRGAVVVDGTGAPAVGPSDVVIEGNRIVDVVGVGAPGVAIDPAGRPEAGEGGRELDVSGMYVLPGFIDLYGHMWGPPEYSEKLSLGHGITTVREPICQDGVPPCVELARKAAADEVLSPRIVPFVHLGVGHDGPYRTAEEARNWVARVAGEGAAGVKCRGERPEILAAVLDEAGRRGLPTSCHLSQLHVARADALDAARWGLRIVEHWYGLPEALLTGGTVQDFPPGFNYAEEKGRFAEAGRLWRQAAPPGSERWNAVLGELVDLGVTLLPTLTLYEANRDLMRAYGAEWHALYTLPELWRDFAPDRTAHAAHWFYWTTADEVAWRENYRLWMAFLDDFKDRGGRVAAGSDSGFMYNLWGFGYVRELELLQEAGFHPLEVIRAATLAGAETLGLADDLGSVEPGKLADLVVVAENPLENLKVLYGTGALELDADNRPVRVGGVRYTIKGGVVYDAPELLADVRRTVAEAKAAEGAEVTPPGLVP